MSNPNDSGTTGAAVESSIIVALRSRPPAWQNDCLDQLDRLGRLQSNWDSYGAQPVHRRSIMHAKWLLS